MKKIAIFDTSICTENIGDKIIMDFVTKEIFKIFKDSFYVTVPTHDIIGKMSYNQIKTSDIKLVCGTNLLSSNMNKYNQWKINLYDSLYLKDIILFGVGWWQYQKLPNLYTKILLKKILSKDKLHSVRDSFTEKQLKAIGINNILNTGCPTMWSLTPEFCKSIPEKKAKNVIFTLTDYNKNIEKDTYLVKTLISNYELVYFWVQAEEDLNYLNKLGFVENIKIVSPTLSALDEILNNKDELDFVGTRLHAGIRALNFKRRTIIIGIDNRALEKAKDFNIVVISREELENKLENTIKSNFATEIKIPLENIKLWKEQFKKY